MGHDHRFFVAFVAVRDHLPTKGGGKSVSRQPCYSSHCQLKSHLDKVLNGTYGCENDPTAPS